VIGLDFVAAGNYTSIPVPKYNNKVQNPNIFDKSTQVVLPRSVLQMPASGKYILFSSAFCDYRCETVHSDTLLNTFACLLFD